MGTRPRRFRSPRAAPRARTEEDTVHEESPYPSRRRRLRRARCRLADLPDAEPVYLGGYRKLGRCHSPHQSCLRARLCGMLLSLPHPVRLSRAALCRQAAFLSARGARLLHQPFHRPQCRRRGAQQRRGALSILFPLGPRCGGYRQADRLLRRHGRPRADNAGRPLPPPHSRHRGKGRRSRNSGLCRARHRLPCRRGNLSGARRVPARRIEGAELAFLIAGTAPRGPAVAGRHGQLRLRRRLPAPAFERRSRVYGNDGGLCGGQPDGARQPCARRARRAGGDDRLPARRLAFRVVYFFIPLPLGLVLLLASEALSGSSEEAGLRKSAS